MSFANDDLSGSMKTDFALSARSPRHSMIVVVN